MPYEESNIDAGSQTCRIPVLDPWDPSLRAHLHSPQEWMCNKVQPQLASQDSQGYLVVHYDPAFPRDEAAAADQWPVCLYRPIGGALKPDVGNYTFTGPDWVPVEAGLLSPRVWVPHVQYLVRCFERNDERRTRPLFESAFAHIHVGEGLGVRELAAEELSLAVVVLDSVSLNQFKRHMRRTWPFMTDVMGFHWLEGYNKVGDNSMVNLLPVLAGLRYGNQSKDMPSDIHPSDYMTNVLRLEDLTFLWDRMKQKGCVTMMNDDIAHVTRGIFHYPPKEVCGFEKKPTDFFYRPYYLHQYRPNHFQNQSQVCFGNNFMPRAHLGILEQFLEKFQRHCHFSFNFMTDLTHGDGNQLGSLDEVLGDLLLRLHSRGTLARTAVLLMGDHGNRIHSLSTTYVGRLEERLPLAALLLPPDLRGRHPGLGRALRANRRRLSSNFDLHQTLLDIAESNWGGGQSEAGRGYRGISLFRELPLNRSCAEAGIAEHFCSCLVPKGRVSRVSPADIKRAAALLKANLVDRLSKASDEQSVCRDRLQLDASLNLTISAIEPLVISQMVRHGLRDQSPASLRRLQARANLELEYWDLKMGATMHNKSVALTARLRVEQAKTPRLSINILPAIYSLLPACSL